MGTQPRFVRIGCSAVAMSGACSPSTDSRKLAAFRLPAAVTTAGAVVPPNSASDHRASPARICSTGFVEQIRAGDALRSEEHTSELQSQSNIVCRLLLEKKK